MLSRIVTQWLVMRSRSSRRRSPWNLLLVPATVLWFAALWYALLLGLRRLVASAPELFPISLPGVTMAAGLAIAALLPAFVMANVTVWLVPAARRAMNREARDHPGTGFRESNLGLLRSARIVVPLGLALAAAAALLA